MNQIFLVAVLGTLPSNMLITKAAVIAVLEPGRRCLESKSSMRKQ
jgi:hypothetical protein